MNVLYDFRSQNYDHRAPGCKIQYVIVHYTAMEDSIAALKWLCSELSNVSAHYLIDEEGGIFSLVSEEHRAWHAGVSCWRGEEDINSRSIGIELANKGDHPFLEAQINALCWLIKRIQEHHQVPSWNILGHADVAPQRKIDPGPFFPWKYLAQQGLGCWVNRQHLTRKEKSPLEIQEKLKKLGYDCSTSGVWDRETFNVIQAFLLKFYPELWIRKEPFLREESDNLKKISGQIGSLLDRLLEN